MPGLTRGRVHRPAHSSPSNRVHEAAAKPGLERKGDDAETAEARVLQLQQRAGNAAVSELLQRQDGGPLSMPDWPNPTYFPGLGPSGLGPTGGPEAPATTTRKTLRYGATGTDVDFLQSRLNAASEVTTHLAVDGHYGPKTIASVKEFQKAHPPLVADGVVGPLTWAEVEKVPPKPLVEDEPRAKKLFMRGAQEYDAKRFAFAYDFFTRAWEISPRSGLVFSRAQALRRLGGRREEAIALYEQYLAMPGGDRKADAAEFIAELRGPGKTGDEATDEKAAKAIFLKGAADYEAGRFGHAYDEFTKANELVERSGLVFSRAQALRRLGGRREEAIALYEQYLAMPDGDRKADAAEFIAELRGPAKTGVEAVDLAASKALFDKGAAHYSAGRFAHAYDEFTKSQQLTDRGGLVFSRAQSLRRLGGRRDEAIELYEQYLKRPDGDRKEDAAFWLNELRNSGAAP